MKKAPKVPKTAESPLQNLPSEGAETAAQDRAKAVQVPTASSSEMEKLVAMTSADSHSSRLETPASGMAMAPAANETRLVALERTHDLVAMHALRLSQSGKDSLSVVLEPGDGTRLSLELRFGNNGIEAQALLHRGDFQFLSRHWSELQQRLEPRGVHLGDLGCSDQSSNGQSRFQTREPADEQSTRSAFAEFALNGPMTDSPAARRGRVKTHAGWETWA